MERMERMKYMHKETGAVDDRDGWIASYTTEELDRRGLTAEEAFTEDEGVTLIVTPSIVENFVD
jgi:hypothetical protein